MKGTLLILTCAALVLGSVVQIRGQATGAALRPVLPGEIRKLELVPPTGIRTRVWLSGGHPVVGRTVFADADSIVLEADGSLVTVPSSRIDGVDLSAGLRHYTARGATLGLLGGAVVGGIIGASTYHHEGCPDDVEYCIDFEIFGSDFYAAVGALEGGLLGMAAGAIVGKATTGERWKSYTRATPVHVSVAPGGRTTLAVKLPL